MDQDLDVAGATRCVLEGHNVIILGQAGVGKTHLIKQLAMCLKEREKKVIMTATTGLASTLLPQGQTIHKFCGIMDGRFSNDQVVGRILEDMEVSI